MDQSSLPTAIGTANALAKNSVVRDLLGPIAKAYGADWGERAQERLEKAKAERRATNLDEHLKNAQREIPVGIIDPAVLEKWAMAVSEIDPLDEELSAAWRAALKAAASGNPFREKMLRALQNMTPDEVYYFVRRTNHFYGLPPEYRRRFVDLGLCEPPKERLVRTMMLALPVGLGSAALYYFFMPRGIDPKQFIEGSDPLTSRFILISLLAGWGIGATALFAWLLSVPSLSRLGAEFRRLSHSRMVTEVKVLSPQPGHDAKEAAGGGLKRGKAKRIDHGDD